MTDTPTTETTDVEPGDAAAPRRYAAYDKVLLRFVGGVHDTKAAAKAAAKAAGVSSVSIHTV